MLQKPFDSDYLIKKIKETHEVEDECNTEIGKIDKDLFILKKRKDKLAKRISHNAKFRHKLINELHELKKLNEHRE